MNPGRISAPDCLRTLFIQVSGEGLVVDVAVGVVRVFTFGQVGDIRILFLISFIQVGNVAQDDGECVHGLRGNPDFLVRVVAHCMRPGHCHGLCCGHDLTGGDCPGVQDFQNRIVVQLDTGLGDRVIGQYQFGFLGPGERNIVHALVLFGHGVLVLVQDDRMVKFQALGAVNGRYDDVGLHFCVLALLLVVLGRQQPLPDGIAADFIAQHILFDGVHELVHVDGAGLELCLIAVDFMGTFDLPFVQHGLYGNEGFVRGGHQLRQFLNDCLLNHADDVACGRERNLVPEFLDELGENRGIERLFRHKADNSGVGEGFLDGLLEQVYVVTLIGQECDLFAGGDAFGHVGPDDVAHDGGDEPVVEVLELTQVFIMQRDLAAEAGLCDGRQAVGLKLNMGVLVGLDILERHVGEVQDFLVGPVVGLQLEGLEDAGTFQHIQCLGVAGPEFVERLAAIRYDANLEKNSTNF